MATTIGPVGRITADPAGPRCTCGRLVYATDNHRQRIAEHNGPYSYRCTYCEEPLQWKMYRKYYYEDRYNKPEGL